MNNNPQNRKLIVRCCKARGWTVQPLALQCIDDYLANDDSDTDRTTAVQRVIDMISPVMLKQISKRTITHGIVMEALIKQSNDKLPQQKSLRNKSSSDRTHEISRERKTKVVSTATDFYLVSAFDMPRLSYDETRRQFNVEEQPWPLLGAAEDKITMFIQRYTLIHQRILRHPLFRPAILSSISSNRVSSNVQHKLTPIESLLGGGGKKNNSILILGLLVQIEEGKYYLEDLTGQVPVVFQDSIEVDGFFVTEQCILLVEGIFYDGHFYVDRLGNPLLETRETSLHAIQQQISHPYFAPRKNGVKNESLSFVILSDVCMDHPRVSQKLESIFAKFDKHSPLDIPCFILMGNFCTPHAHLIQQQHQMTQYSSSYNRTANAIDELVTLIEKFPNLSQHAHFCLIPGPTDYAVLGSAHLHVLPLPPITKVMRSTLSSINNRNVANLHHGSNPCRIRWAGKEIVIFRHDLLHLFQQNEVLGQKFNSTAVTDVDLPMSLDLDTNHHRLPQCRLVKTILDQGHLLPFPNQPLYWNYDSSLRLYPIPDAIILGGGGQTVPFHEVYGGCNVVHPGSLMNAALSNANTPTSSYAHFTLDKDSRSSQESDVDASSVDFLD